MSAILLVVEARRPRQYASPGQVACTRSWHQISFISPVPNFHPQSLKLIMAVSQTQLTALYPPHYIESNFPVPPSLPLSSEKFPALCALWDVNHPIIFLWLQLGHSFLIRLWLPTLACFPCYVHWCRHISARLSAVLKSALLTLETFCPAAQSALTALSMSCLSN